jgi:hypothetical protein
MRELHLFGLGYGPVANCCDHDEVFLIDNSNKSPHIEMYSLTHNSERIVCESVHFNICACVGTDCQTVHWCTDMNTVKNDELS